ncbi:MAG: peptide chain release factor N(5)-glutamine methyltransferase, partial [Chloroflexi bacterium]|nr:peptide chain release factor N(5)-glutamine methyltransferase [Chloroflexota bacterium]
LALDGGPDGMDLIRRLLTGLPNAMLPGGVALLEMAADQATAMHTAVAEALPSTWSVVIHPDLGGRPRIAELSQTSEDRR